MNRHTGEVLWYGNPAGGENVGANTPAFSNDGSVVYVTNDVDVVGLTKAGGPLWNSVARPVYDWVSGENNPQRAQSTRALSDDEATYYFRA